MKKFSRTGKFKNEFIEVFKTNVADFYQSGLVKVYFLNPFPLLKVSFHLQNGD
jgi:hypothetical protein